MNFRISLLLVFCWMSFSAFGQDYFLNGTAIELGNDCYQLTAAAGAQNGSVWYSDQIDLNEPFDIEFLMNFGTNDGNGADGMVFILQTVGVFALGESGGGMGYLGFDPSFGIEFDTWQNNDSGDPSADHIGMISNGSVDHDGVFSIADPVQASSLSTNIEDGEDHVVRIVWDPEEFVISVYFDCVFRTSANVNLVNAIFNGYNEVFWGFSGGTGGAWNNQVVCLQDNILDTSDDISVCSGETIQLFAAGNTDGVFEWSPATYLDDPFSQNPLCTPEETTTYTVTYDNLCGGTITNEVTVTIDDMEVEIDAPFDVITCESGQLIISGSNNFDNQGDFVWSNENGEIAGTGGEVQIEITQAGTYTLDISLSEFCFASDEITIEVDTEPYTVELSDWVVDCDNTPATISVETNGNDAEFDWTYSGPDGFTFDDDSAESFETESSGVYTVVVTNPNNGCESTAEATVTSNVSYPEFSLSTPDSLTCENQFDSIEMIPNLSGDDTQIEWSTTDGNIVGIEGSDAIVDSEGIYSVTVTNLLNGCSTTESMSVFESDFADVDLSSLTFPNVMTPNIDGVNEGFFPFLSNDPQFDLVSLAEKFDLQVYNRWGGLIHESTAPRPWNGTDQSGEGLNGTFYYIVDYHFECQTKEEGTQSGVLEILK